RARAIYNISVTGAEGRPDRAVQLDVNHRLRELEAHFDQFARGEMPRLLVKRSKVLRRLREMGVEQTDADGDLLLAAYQCLDRAADIATYGSMVLYEADTLLERAKVHLCHARYPDASAEPSASRVNAERSFKLARDRIRELKYNKRLPELKHLTL